MDALTNETTAPSWEDDATAPRPFTAEEALESARAEAMMAARCERDANDDPGNDILLVAAALHQRKAETYREYARLIVDLRDSRLAILEMRRLAYEARRDSSDAMFRAESVAISYLQSQAGRALFCDE